MSSSLKCDKKKYGYQVEADDFLTYDEFSSDGGIKIIVWVSDPSVIQMIVLKKNCNPQLQVD